LEIRLILVELCFCNKTALFRIVLAVCLKVIKLFNSEAQFIQTNLNLIISLIQYLITTIKLIFNLKKLVNVVVVQLYVLHVLPSSSTLQTVYLLRTKLNYLEEQYMLNNLSLAITKILFFRKTLLKLMEVHCSWIKIQPIQTLQIALL
jgi:hypothetical protein